MNEDQIGPHRPTLVTVFVIVNLLFGFRRLIAAIQMVLPDPANKVPVSILQLLVANAVAIGILVVGFEIYRRREWAWWCAGVLYSSPLLQFVFVSVMSSLSPHGVSYPIGQPILSTLLYGLLYRSTVLRWFGVERNAKAILSQLVASLVFVCMCTWSRVFYFV